MRFRFFIFLICAIIFSVSAQNRKQLDSLYALERAATDDSVRVNILNTICDQYLIIEPEVALDYANQAIELAEKIKYTRGKAYAYRNMAIYYYNNGAYSNALNNHNSALELFEVLKDKKGLLLCYNSIGLINYKQGYYPLAIKNYLASMLILEEFGDKSGMASTYASVGKIYTKDGNHTLALDYMQSALKIQLELNDKDAISDVYNSIGDIEFEKTNYTSALDYYLKSLKIQEEINNPNVIAQSYNSLGDTYLKLNNFDLAISYQKKALAIQQNEKDKTAEAATLNSIGDIYSALKKYQEAIQNYEGALLIAKKYNVNETLKNAYWGLSQSYSMIGNYGNAYNYYQKYTEIKDMLFNKENSKNLAELNAKFENERKEKEISHLHKENEFKELAAKRQKLILNLVIVGLITMVVFAFLMYRNNMQKRAALKLLEEKNEIITKQKEEGEREKKRSEELLLNILPTETAEELKNYGKAAPRSYKMVTVLFTDFKGFTSISEKLTPEQLVYELDFCFRKFDEITSRYGIEKIKTIGDAYMCAGGIPIRNRSNPVDVMLAAFEIQEFMEEWKRDKIANGKEFWEIRIGVHTGPVVAGIVGSKKFAYDIWGDTVNTASRMESSGEAGKINVSGTTYGYLSSFFDCTYRGKITAKNKGEIEMYFVDRIKPRLSVNLEGRKPNDDFTKLLSTNLSNRINYKDAGQHILKLLSEFLPENLTYHNVHHTLGVCSAVERIAKTEGIEGEQVDLLKTAALFHDAGFIRRYDSNEEIGVEIAREVLPQYGYSKKQIEIIARLIMATKIPQQPNDLLEQIMCDADLDYLGRNDFHDIADSLRQELVTYSKIKTKRQWDEIQVRFLTQHAYFTQSAIKRRQAKKEEYLEEIKIRLTQLYDDEPTKLA